MQLRAVVWLAISPIRAVKLGRMDLIRNLALKDQDTRLPETLLQLEGEIYVHNLTALSQLGMIYTL